MVSVISKLAVCAAVMATAGSALEVGEYYRPTGEEVSGVAGSTTEYARSPCPALNALANHGYIARSGKGITHEELQNAIVANYNLDASVAKALASRVPASLSLSDLGKHNFIEHDVSLVHSDSVYGDDPAALNQTLYDDLMSRAEDGYLTLDSIAAARGSRIDACKARGDTCEFGTKQRILGVLENAILLRCLGGFNEERISVEYAQSFFVDERIPDDFHKSETVVSPVKLILTATKLESKVTWSDILEFFGL
ncbi:hypothetical protein Poli38472_011558 [Pythium oligandrum]|uniref:Heme haloperoxidase family profile domain-containing protein n=1 Tax=Pythium oligandrum TaxID=41045 RepID=A0A8K1FNI8_PYTOL|nr:hypothetical protein Poli38472_011558 [Pythium oligandrum]|eukprot:TMW64678.1 hypothetical protein Poli38472_011558 [Pythium oligandrum]